MNGLNSQAVLGLEWMSFAGGINMRFLAAVVLAGLLASKVCHADGQATLIISVSRPEGAPSALYLRPNGVAADDQKSRIKVMATLATSKTSLFVARVDPGDYVLDATGLDPAAVSVTSVLMAELPVAEVVPGTAKITLKANQILDLGMVRQDTLGGNLPLLLRSENSSNFRLFPSALAAAGVAQANSGAWPKPEDELERRLFARSMNRLPGLLGVEELEDGRWLAANTLGEIRIRDVSGRWSNVARAGDGFWTAFEWISSDQQLLVSEFNDVVLLGKGAERTLLSRIPTPRTVTHINCNQALACTALASSNDGFDVLYSTNARAGGWKSLGSGLLKFSAWTGVLDHAWGMTIGGKTLVVWGKDQLWRVDPAVGTLDTLTLPFRPVAPVALGGRISDGEYYSDNDGRDWTKLDKRMRDGTVMLDGSGRGYVTSVDLGMVMKPIIRRSNDGKVGWTTVGPLPIAGTLLVGRHGSAMYLLAKDGELWLSTDGGDHWQPDLAPSEGAKS
jgi:hypothetical protein